MRDVSRNEANVGLSHMRKFLECVLVMELPDKCDLSANSCVNVENRVSIGSACNFF
jgi:hypothetical protein